MKKSYITAACLLTLPLLVLGGCAQNHQRPATTSLTNEQVDRACILQAGSDLQRILHLEATGGRALPPPAGMKNPSPATDRLVELDTTSVGQKVTYSFLCSTNASGTAFTSPLGHN